MKTLTKGILTALLILTINVVFGQKGIEDGSRYGHGEDSIRCIKNLSLYRANVRNNDFGEITLNSWTIVYNECPKASKYIYIDGARMIESSIRKTKDEAQKEILVDSLMHIYDQRIENYGQKGYVLGLKGVDFIQYANKTVENMQKGYDLLKESIQLEKYESGPAQLLTFFQASNSLYQANALEAGVVVSDFGMVIEIADYLIKKGTSVKNMEMVKSSAEKIFAEGGAANCDDLIPFYAKKFEETPEDTEFLKKATDLLRSTKCTDSELFFNMAEKLNSISPAANLAKELAKITNQKDKLEVSARYYKQAIELQNDNIEKANYYLELGDVTRRLGNYSQARTYALKSIELNPANGYPYLLIGNIYAASSKSCSEDEFEQKTVYWAAVDKFAKAKAVDAALTENANKYIETYIQYFPDNETIFFYGLKEGDTYKVGCWINENTTVRSR